MKVYRLITRNSYEREMFDKASLKLGLDKAVLQSMSGREGSIAGVNAGVAGDRGMGKREYKSCLMSAMSLFS